MNNKSKSKLKFNTGFVNHLETLKGVSKTATKHAKDISATTAKTFNNELVKKIPGDFMDQLFGPSQKSSAEFGVGESLEMKEVAFEEQQKRQELERQVSYERKLRREEEVYKERQGNELRLQLQAIMQEVVVITEKTTELAQETKIAAMQAPSEPGVYHIMFFTKLLDFLKSFRKKIENASVWLHSANGRAAKKGWVANYKKSGAKYLLSGEHYLTRSAG